MSQKIKEARMAIGMSRAEMSRQFGIPVRTIEDWDAGKNKCSKWVEKLVLDKLADRRKSMNHKEFDKLFDSINYKGKELFFKENAYLDPTPKSHPSFRVEALDPETQHSFSLRWNTPEDYVVKKFDGHNWTYEFNDVYKDWEPNWEEPDNVYEWD